MRTRPPRRAARIARSSTTHCPACGKKSYRTRKDAKKAARTFHPNDRMSAYQCRHEDGLGWHFGHSDLWRWWRDQENAT